MKIKMNIPTVFLTILVAATVAGCSGGNGGGNNADFFTIATVFRLNGFVRPDPFVAVSGQAAFPTINCTQFPNGVSSFNGTTDANGQFTVANAALGGNGCAWNIVRGASPNCSQASSTTIFVTFPGEAFNIPCSAPGQTPFTARPSFIDPTSPPAAMTISGTNISSTYGMPQVTFYDVNQTVWLTVTATSVSSDGTSLTIPASQITFPDDGYGAVVYIKQSDGTWGPLGGAAVRLFTPSGTPPGKCKPRMNCC